MVVVGREFPLGGKGWGGKNRRGRGTAGAPVSGQADASVATEALEGPELDEQDEGSTETDDGAGGNVETSTAANQAAV